MEFVEATLFQLQAAARLPNSGVSEIAVNAALAMIEPMAPRLSNYFHFFGAKGAFLMQLGRNDEARIAFDRAIALANTTAEAAHIRMHLDRLMRDMAIDMGVGHTCNRAPVGVLWRAGRGSGRPVLRWRRAATEGLH